MAVIALEQKQTMLGYATEMGLSVHRFSCLLS